MLKFVTTVVGFALLVLLGAAAVLGLGWLVSLAVRALLGVGMFQSLVLAFGVLGILVLFVNAVALKSIAGLSDLIHATIGTGEPDDETKDEEDEEEAEGTWFSPCPLRSRPAFRQMLWKARLQKTAKLGPRIGHPTLEMTR